jgi:hypothetical protein
LAGNPALVKCQRSTDQGLYDYIAPYSAKLPASKSSAWIQDRFVQDGADHLANVPSC